MSTSIESAIQLFDAESRQSAESRVIGDAGFLDLLGAEPASTGVSQDLMLSRVVPQIYERWWRPALGRAVKGATGPGMDDEIRIARLLLALSAGHRVLDVACGPGNFTRPFAEVVGDDGLAVGIDVSATMLARGAREAERAGLDNVALLRADACALPFAAGSFDGICCFGALHLFAEPGKALEEMVRVLAPGGRIAVMTSIRRSITPPALKPVLQRASGLRIFEADEIVGELEARGLTDVHQRVSGLVQFVGGRLPT
jgi:ubiquinone/menaquinone biosynthesis C-methylase UbiE